MKSEKKIIFLHLICFVIEKILQKLDLGTTLLDLSPFGPESFDPPPKPLDLFGPKDIWSPKFNPLDDWIFLE